MSAVFLAVVLAWAAQGEETPQSPPAKEQAKVESQADAKQEGDSKAKQRADRSKRPGSDASKRGGAPSGDPTRGMSREEAQRWWEGLSEEERKQARERMRSYREMSPEAREELKRRAELLRSVGKEVLTSMDEKQRAAFEKLPPAERERMHRELVRKELERRGEKVESWEEMGPPQGLEDRLKRSGRMREEHRQKRRERELQAAIEEGWLSAKAVEKLKDQSGEQVERTLEQVRQWRMIDWLDRRDGWKRLEIDEAERERLKAMEPRAFLEEMRTRMGKMRGRGPGGRPGEGRGEGPGPKRGDGPGSKRGEPRGEGSPPGPGPENGPPRGERRNGPGPGKGPGPEQGGERPGRRGGGGGRRG